MNTICIINNIVDAFIHIIVILKEKIVVFGEPVSFEKFTSNSISVIIAFVNLKAFEEKYKVIRDLLAKYGWYMTMKQDYIKNGELTGFKQLVFEPAQKRTFINTVMKFLKSLFV